MGARSHAGALGAILLLAACTDNSAGIERFPCPAVSADAAVEVSGRYRYASYMFLLSGTITFSRDAASVMVTDTTYDQGKDRSLVGPGQLVGNRLDLVLTPKNGQTDYRADVSLVFTGDSRRFCVLTFSDTNGDTGGLGSYLGERR